MTSLERAVQHYGWRYDYRSRAVTTDMRIGVLPDWVEQLAERLYRETGTFDRVPDQAIVNEYLPGQGIAMHIDRQCFGDTVATVSLGDCLADGLCGRWARTDPEPCAWCLAPWLGVDPERRSQAPVAAWHREAQAVTACECGSWRPRERRVSVTFRTVLP